MQPQAHKITDEYSILARRYHWHPEAIFGLCYEYIQPGQRLLDVGVGSGLASLPFADAGLEIFGCDTSPATPAAWISNGVHATFRQQDIQTSPWQYEADSFDHVICCGVLHFFSGLETVFAEVARLLRPQGLFAFTTKATPPDFIAAAERQFYTEIIQETHIYSHSRAYLEHLLNEFQFTLLKELRMLIITDRNTEDVFPAFVTQKRA